MKTKRWAGWVAFGLFGAAGCSGVVTSGDAGGTTGGGGGGGETSTGSSTGSGGQCLPPEPTQHRPQAIACPPSTPEPGMPPTVCTVDNNCVGPWPGPMGKCGPSMVCEFNQCTTDADCGGTDVCSCQGESSVYGGKSYGSTCIQADCQVDADCGAGGFCSPTESATCGGSYGVAGYDCRSCQDTCSQDSDCTEPNAPPRYCAYDPSVKHWQCDSSICAG